MRGVNSSYSRARYWTNAGVNSSAAPETGAKRTRGVANICELRSVAIGVSFSAISASSDTSDRVKKRSAPLRRRLTVGIRAGLPCARVDLQEVNEGEGAAKSDDAAIQTVIA